MKYKNAFIFLTGLVVGAGTVGFVKSKAGKNAAVAITSKGLELKEKVACMAEQTKEMASDVIAEAKYRNEKKNAPEDLAAK